MPELPFSKYHGCGNDFVLINNMDGKWSGWLSHPENICQMTDRHTGVGADGLIQIKSHPNYDYERVYYNANVGEVSQFCGNGSRCCVIFARDLGIVKKKKGTYLACDGPHDFQIADDDSVILGMTDVNMDRIKVYSNGHSNEYHLFVGSPHHVKFVDDISKVNVQREGAEIRYSDLYKKKDENGLDGINVNFNQIKMIDGKARLKIRTYERGIEREMLACGSGSVSSALALVLKLGEGSLPKLNGKNVVHLETPGGNITVSFTYNAQITEFKDITLTGPAIKVFDGTYVI